tara:strand:+ start:4211 stop:4435 length:225 start_codon:yes stop_codon:yes gene_type:complete
MRQYLCQIRVAGLYIHCVVMAASEEMVLDKIAESLNQGSYKVEEEGFYDPKRIYVTFEETSNGVTETGVGKTAT